MAARGSCTFADYTHSIDGTIPSAAVHAGLIALYRLPRNFISPLGI